MTAAARDWAYRGSLACLAAMIVLPPLNPIHIAPLPSFIEEWLALVFGTAAVSLAVGARGLRLDELPRVVPWFVAFAVLLAAQVLRDLPYREQALLPALYVLWAVALAWLGLVLRQQLGAERTARVLAACVLLAACASAVFALVQSSGIATPLNWLISRPQSARAYANLNQPNLLADLLALGAVSAVFLRCSGMLGLSAAGSVLALLAIAMALTGSRSGFAFVVWTLAWSAWWAHASPGDASRKAVRAAGIFLAAFLAAQLLIALFGAPEASVASARAIGLGDEGPGSPSARLYIWAQAVHMFRTSPLFGVGPGMFAWNFFLNAPEFGGLLLPGAERFAHDLLLQLLAETGLAGAALVAIPLALWFSSNVRSQSEAWRWWCVAFTGVNILHSLVENPLWYAHFLGPFALVLGLGDRGAYVLKRANIVRIAAPALVLAGAVSLASSAAGYREAIAWLRPARADTTLVPMQHSILRPYAEVLASPVLMPPGKFDPGDVPLSERLVRFMPIDLAVYRHIRMLSQAGRIDEARSLLERAVIVFPDTLSELRRELRAAPASPGTRDMLRLLDERAPAAKAGPFSGKWPLRPGGKGDMVPGTFAACGMRQDEKGRLWESRKKSASGTCWSSKGSFPASS